MSRQLLRNSQVVIEYNGRVFNIGALSQFSSTTSLSEVSNRRKTLFSNTTKQYTHTDRINSTSTTLNLYLTDNYLENVFFELVGLDSGVGVAQAFLPDSVNTTTRLFSMYIVNEDSVMYSEHNFVEAIDISFSKASILSLSINISSANLKRVNKNILSTFPSAPINQGNILAPAPIRFQTGDRVWDTIKSATISVQQEAEWIDDKSLFDIAASKTFEYTRAATSDLIISSTIQTNYETTSSIFNEALFQDVEIANGTFGLVIKNARVVHNLDIQPVYGNRLDVSIAEDTDETYFYFGE